MLAQYYTHDDDTLKYIDTAIIRISYFINTYCKVRGKDHEDGDFNFLKYYSLVHVVPSIRLFGPATSTSTELPEYLYIESVKELYRRTNYKNYKV